MSRKDWFLAAAMLLVPYVIWPQTQTEFQNYWERKGGSISQITLTHTDSIAPNARYFIWGLANKSWGEGIVGVSTKLGPIEAGLGAGIETYQSTPWRLKANFFSGDDMLTFAFASVEAGGSGQWYLFETSSRTLLDPVFGTKRFGLGVRLERFVGFGPRFEVALNEHFVLWTVPIAWDIEKHNEQHSYITLRFSP